MSQPHWTHTIIQAGLGAMCGTDPRSRHHFFRRYLKEHLRIPLSTTTLESRMTWKNLQVCSIWRQDGSAHCGCQWVGHILWRKESEGLSWGLLIHGSYKQAHWVHAAEVVERACPTLHHSLVPWLFPLSKCYGLNCAPPPTNSYLEALTPNLAVFKDRAFKKVIKVKGSQKVAPYLTWFNMTDVSVRWRRALYT